MPSKKRPAPEPGVVNIYPKAEKKKSVPADDGFTIKTLPRWDGFLGKDGKLRVKKHSRFLSGDPKNPGTTTTYSEGTRYVHVNPFGPSTAEACMEARKKLAESPREAREAKVLKLEEHIVHLKAENKRLRDVISFLSAPLEFGSTGGFHIDR